MSILMKVWSVIYLYVFPCRRYNLLSYWQYQSHVRTPSTPYALPSLSYSSFQDVCRGLLPHRLLWLNSVLPFNRLSKHILFLHVSPSWSYVCWAISNCIFHYFLGENAAPDLVQNRIFRSESIQECFRESHGEREVICVSI